MSIKYAAPPVEMRDIANALPQLPSPLLWRISFYPRPRQTSSLSPCIELCYVMRDGSTLVFKRWGRGGRSQSTRELLGALLIAAQEAHNYVGNADPAELARRIAWDMGLPAQL